MRALLPIIGFLAASAIPAHRHRPMSNTVPTPQGVLYSWGFDDGTLGKIHTYTPNLATVVSDPTANGGKALQLTWVRDGGEHAIYLETPRVPPGNKTIFVRFRYKQDATANNGGIKKTVRFRSQRDGDNSAGTFNIQTGEFLFFGDSYGDAKNHSQFGHGTGDPNFVSFKPDTFHERWRYIECMVDYSTPGHQRARMWIDNTLVIDYDATANPAPYDISIMDVYLASTFNAPGDTRREWFDDIVISTSRIGAPAR